MNPFFANFPIVTYNGSDSVLNITEKVKILDSVRDNPYAFYPYTLADNERADQTAAGAYNDPYLNWMIWITNGIVDPYYDWYMDDTTFYNHIVNKYGSWENASLKIEYWVNNWYNNSETILSQSEYNLLPFEEFKYWEPSYSDNYFIGYKRRQIDSRVNTNQMVSLNVPNAQDFANDSMLFFNSNYYGTIVSISDSVIYLNHVLNSNLDIIQNAFNGITITPTLNLSTIGITVPRTLNTTSILNYMADPLIVTGYESGNTGQVLSYRNMVQNISLNEISYWSPLTALDKEIARNQYNQTINLLSSKLVSTLNQNLKVLLNE